MKNTYRTPIQIEKLLISNHASVYNGAIEYTTWTNKIINLVWAPTLGNSYRNLTGLEMIESLIKYMEDERAFYPRKELALKWVRQFDLREFTKVVKDEANVSDYTSRHCLSNIVDFTLAVLDYSMYSMP